MRQRSLRMANGLSQVGAYEKAGYVRDIGHASRLATAGHIKHRVAELQQRNVAKADEKASVGLAELQKMAKQAYGPGDHDRAPPLSCQDCRSLPALQRQAFLAHSEKRAGQMPSLLEIIRNSDMITWNEQKPDFVRRSLNDLVSHLPFTRACAIALAADRMPRVLVRQSVMAGILDHLQEQGVEMGGLYLAVCTTGWAAAMIS
jgi:hypothetical protein